MERICVIMPLDDDHVREPPDGGDWVRFPLDKHSTHEEIEEYIAREISGCLADLWMQLAREADFSDRDRAAVMYRAAVLVAPEVRKNIGILHAKMLRVQ